MMETFSAYRSHILRMTLEFFCLIPYTENGRSQSWELKIKKNSLMDGTSWKH